MEKKIYNTLLNSVIGDALGTPVEGLGKSHIRAVFKIIDGYIDPEPALKNRLESWKKPGLYSSISQMALALSASLSESGFNQKLFSSSIGNSPEVEDSETGIFRHPDSVIKKYIVSSRNKKTMELASSPSAKVISAALPFSLQRTFDRSYRDILIFSLLFTSDPSTAAGCLIYPNLLKNMLESEDEDMNRAVYQAIETVKNIIKYSEQNEHIIFSCGLNPDSIIENLKLYSGCFEMIAEATSQDSGEEKICEALNQKLKTPVKRATVNHPLAIFPFSLLKMKFSQDITGLLSGCAMEGGCSSALCSISGALAGALGHHISEESFLVKNLVNKKSVANIISHIASQGISIAEIQAFIHSEQGLTKKEIEEHKSKLRHYKNPIKKKKPLKDYESEITKHVVESWTKLDRARWKKERKNFNDKNG